MKVSEGSLFPLSLAPISNRVFVYDSRLRPGRVKRSLMTRMMIVLGFAVCSCLGATLLASTVVAEDKAFEQQRADNWHQWRGPLATGEAPRANPPVHWNAQTNIKWKTLLPGEGSATPIVWGDQIFILAAIKTERMTDTPAEADETAKTTPPSNYYRFVVLSIDRKTGRIRWQQVATEEVPREGQHFTNTYASASPITDGKRLYVSFGSRGIYCYDLDGELLWKQNLGTMRTRYGWGEAVTPALYQDTLIVNWDHEDQSFIVALDAATGETRWKADRDEPTSWATPLIVPRQNQTQVIVNGTNRVRSYDLTNGEVIWECGGQTINAIPSPVLFEDTAIVMSGYRGAAAFAIPLEARGDITGTSTVRWSHGRHTPYVPSPLLVGERLYFTAANNGILSCLNLRDGATLFGPERLSAVANVYASPLAASGRIYITGRDGTTLVLKQSDKLEELATNRLDDPIDASPVAVGNQLFLRSNRYLYCIEEN